MPGKNQSYYLIYPNDALLLEWAKEYLSMSSRSEVGRNALEYTTDLMMKLEALSTEIEMPSYADRTPAWRKGQKGRNLSTLFKDKDKERLEWLSEFLGCSRSEAIRTTIRIYAAFLAPQAK